MQNALAIFYLSKKATVLIIILKVYIAKRVDLRDKTLKNRGNSFELKKTKLEKGL